MKKYFDITTSRDTADKIVSQLELSIKLDKNYPMRLKRVIHESTYSIVDIEIEGNTISPDRIFFLGLFTGMDISITKIQSDEIS